MSRSYTAVLADGTTYQIDDIPDDVHPNDVIGKVEQSMGRPVKEMIAQDRRLGSQVKEYAKDAVRGPLKAVAGGLENFVDNVLPRPLMEKERGDDWGPGNRPTELVEKLLPTPKNDPQSRNVGRAVIEGGTGALVGPGGVSAPVRTALTGAAAGAGSELAGHLSGGNQLARLGGGLAGGLAAGVTMAPKTTRGQLAQQTLEGVDPAQLGLAKRIMEEAAKEGINLNLSQAMPNASNIDQLVGVLANSPNGKEIVRQLRAQPLATSMAVEGGMSSLPGKVGDQQTLANDMQSAATDIIKNVKSARTDLVSPLYNAAGDLGKKGNQALVTQVDRFLSGKGISPKVEAQAKELREQLLTGKNGGPRMDAADVKAAIDSVQGGIKSTLNPLSASEQGQLKYLVSQLYGELGNRSPITKLANDIYGSVSASRVDPLKKSVVGRLAGNAGAQTDREAVKGKVFGILDAGTLPGNTKSEILTLEKSLRGAKQQEIFQDTVKTWMADKVSKASQQKGGRQSEQTAANIEAAFLGDPTKEQGFKDMMVGLARSKGLPDDALLPGMQNILKFVSSAARRPARVGGVTEQGLDEASRSRLAGAAGNFSLIQPFRAVAQKLDDSLNADAYRFMDRLLTTPEGVDTLRKLGKTPIMSRKMTDTLSTFLATEAADDPAE